MRALQIDETFDHKPGRPQRDGSLVERLRWSLWQCWQHHPQDSEAYAAHRLVVELDDWRQVEWTMAEWRRLPKLLRRILIKLFGAPPKETE